eukprot:935094-Alexandrium_andersonii.AAC.1
MCIRDRESIGACFRQRTSPARNMAPKKAAAKKAAAKKAPGVKKTVIKQEEVDDAEPTRGELSRMLTNMKYAANKSSSSERQEEATEAIPD